MKTHAEMIIANVGVAMGVKMEWFWANGCDIRFGAMCEPPPTGPGIYSEKGTFIDAIVELRA